MAKGIITLENGEDFFTRWTGYDRIIQIVIKELKQIEGAGEFLNWLKTRIPDEFEDRGNTVFFNQNGEMIQRILDLRGLTYQNRTYFWEALKNGRKKLLKFGQDYSILNPDRIQELIAMHENITVDLHIESELNTKLFIKGEEIDKIGPGW